MVNEMQKVKDRKTAKNQSRCITMHDLNQGAMPISEAVVALNGGGRG